MVALTTLKLRSANGVLVAVVLCFHRVLYYGDGGPTLPQARWQDNSHLVINHPDDEGYPLKCKSAREVIVVCESQKVD